MNSRRWLWRTMFPPVLVLIVALIVWEVLTRWRIAMAAPGDYLLPLPMPSGMAQVLFKQRASFAAATWTTAKGALLGFGFSALTGIATAIVLSSSVWVRRAFYPYTLLFQTVPVIAIAPMLEIWSGAGLTAVVIVAWIVSVFPVIANTLSGLLATEAAMEDLFRLYGAGPLTRLWKLRLPSALPQILTGLRIAAGLSVIGTIVAEFFVGTYGADEGLGVKVVTNAKYAHTDAVFVGVLLASLLGLMLFGSVNLAGRLILRHRNERPNDEV